MKQTLVTCFLVGLSFSFHATSADYALLQQDSRTSRIIDFYEGYCPGEALIACNEAMSALPKDSLEVLPLKVNVLEIRAEMLLLQDLPELAAGDCRDEINLLAVMGKGNSKEMANATYQYAAILDRLGVTAEAIDFYQRSYLVVVQMREPRFPELSDLYRCFARDYRALGVRQQADAFYSAIIIEEAANCQSSKHLALEEYGCYLQQRGDYELAKAYFMKAIQVLKEEQPLTPYNIALLELRVAEHFMQMKTFGSVPSLLEDAHRIAAASAQENLYADSSDMGYVELTQALYLKITGRLNDAQEVLNKANNHFSKGRSRTRAPYKLSDLQLDEGPVGCP
jgi:tetratricopeptide (TPR) repeat protein